MNNNEKKSKPAAKSLSDLTAFEQWDAVIHQASEMALVGQAGYKTVMKGRKGAGIEVVNVTFFPKERVRNAQANAARCVRVFRSHVIDNLNNSVKLIEARAKEVAKQYAATWFFQVGLRRSLEREGVLLEERLTNA